MWKEDTIEEEEETKEEEEEINYFDEQVKKEDTKKYNKNLEKLKRLEFAYESIKDLKKKNQLENQITNIKYQIYEFKEHYNTLNDNEKKEYNKIKRNLGLME